jgi:hypothetical protein
VVSNIFLYIPKHLKTLVMEEMKRIPTHESCIGEAHYVDMRRFCAFSLDSFALSIAYALIKKILRRIHTLYH